MKKHGKAKKGSAARSGKPKSRRTRLGSVDASRRGTMRKLARNVRKSSKSSVRKMSRSKSSSRKAGKARSRVARPASRPRPAAVPVSGHKAADEVPTLEQVTITCANCGRPFKIMKLKGLSLEGTICQRCSLGEMELPESFG